VLTVGAEYSKLFVVVGPFIGHCSVMRGEAAGSIRSRSLKMLVEGNRIENADHIGVTLIGPRDHRHQATPRTGPRATAGRSHVHLWIRPYDETVSLDKAIRAEPATWTQRPSFIPERIALTPPLFPCQPSGPPWLTRK
jgi:hypothetical protein